ncbi:MAG TPA: hypothetical protein VG826_17695 [Pirellulales bacterium]|nr:hypothetical protein [Pirellulales bacterium]
MAKKKEGDLRLLKDGVVFGPTDRAWLDRLLSAGRVTLEDRISVRNADWISIADYLATAQPPDAAASPEAASAGPVPATQVSSPPAAGQKKAGDLRVLNNGRVISALTRAEVQQLLAGGRLDEDDLVCALDGPWMRVGDFLSTKSVVQPSRQRWSQEAGAPAPGGPEGRSPVGDASPHVDRSADSNATMPMVVMAGHVEVVQSKTPPLPLAEPMAVVGKAVASPDPAVAYQLGSAGKEKPKLEDQWYVRIRAMCSAPLGKRHLKALYQSREITSETVARHPKWHENDWRPIDTIPELADLSQP